MTECRVRMQPQVRLGLRGGVRSMDLRGAPLLGVIAEQDAAAGRVDVEAVREVAADAVEEALRFPLAREVPALLRPSGYSRHRAR